MNQIRRHLSNTKILSVCLSVLLSVFLVAVFAGAATTVTISSIGIATATPGVMLGVKGAAIVEGFVRADYFTSTSTNSSWVFGNVGIATTTPGSRLAVHNGDLDVGGILVAETHIKTSSIIATSSVGIATSTPGVMLGVKGAAIVDGFVLSDFLVATSTTADSWIMGGLGIGTTTVSDTLEKDGGLAAEGSAIFGGGVTASYVKATSTTSSSIGRLGVSTTSPWALFSVEALEATTDNSVPIFAIGDTGSSSPMMVVNASSSVGFFTKSPRTPFNVHNDVGTSTIYISTGGNYGDLNHGGQIILKDADGATCTVIVAQGGTIDVSDITCPAESD